MTKPKTINLLWTLLKYKTISLFAPDFASVITQMVKHELRGGRLEIRLYEKSGNIFYHSLESLFQEYCYQYCKLLEYNSRIVMIGVREMILLDLARRKDLSIYMDNDAFGNYLVIKKIQ